MPVGTLSNPVTNPSFVTFVYGDAAAIDGSFFVADRAYRVVGISARSTIAGTDGGAVSATVKKAPSATAISGGTLLHAGSLDLKTTANTNMTALVLSATAADLDLAAGDAVGLDVTGTTTAARGCVTLALMPI